MKVPRALDKGCSWHCKEREDVKGKRKNGRIAGQHNNKTG